MERRKPVVKDHPNLSPSPEAPSDDGRLQSFARHSRATSEARSDVDARFGFESASRPSVPRPDSDSDVAERVYGSPTTPSRVTEEQMAAYRSSRAGSEAPQRGPGELSPQTPSPGKRAAHQQLHFHSQRSSRAGSEAPDREGDDSRQGSRAGSEAPQRYYDASANTAEGLRVSRAGSQAGSPTRTGPVGGSPGSPQGPTIMSPASPPPPASTNASAGASAAAATSVHEQQQQQQSLHTKRVKGAKTSKTAMFSPPTEHSSHHGAGAGHRTSMDTRRVLHQYGNPSMPAQHIHDVERYIYHTVKRSTGSFDYFQLLHYPLTTTPSSQASRSGAGEDDEDCAIAAMGGIAIDTAVSGEEGFALRHASAESASSGSVKEPSPMPRGPSTSDGSSSGSGGGGIPMSQALASPKENSDSPSPKFDESAFNTTFDAPDFLNQSGGNLEESFHIPLHVEEPTQQSVSVLAMTTLPDPVSGAPVLGLCLGDYNGHVEYFEVSSSESNNKKIRKSKSLAHSSRRSLSASAGTGRTRGSGGTDAAEGRGDSLDSEATVNITHDMRGREVARRHSHKAFVKSINALTSVAVEPCVKCISFVRPHSSPSMISYLTANERVIKLFHVRREGFTPFSAFPYMEEVVGRTFMGSRYFARLPPQTSILPIKEYGPSANSIQALSVSADGETFLSVEDLQVFWWSFEAADTTKATCIADLRPPSGALDEVEELVTAASFHPTHSSLFMLSRSSGVLNIGDLRDPPSREQRQYAITTQVTPQQNPTSCPAYDEILCSISAAAFLSPDHVITRDYLSLKLWDLRKPDMPYAMTPVMNYVARYLDPLYENDSIFDRFPVAVDDVSGTVVTGLYDGAVAVWQPLSPSLPAEEALVHYRVNPFVEPADTSHGGRVTVRKLEDGLAAAWHQHPSVRQAAGQDAGSNGDGVRGGGGGLDGMDGDGGMEEIPEPFTNKVLNVAVAPGGERFGYTYKNGRLVYVFERRTGRKISSH